LAPWLQYNSTYHSMIVSHVSAPHNPCQDDNVRHQALTAPNPSLNSWLCVSLSRTNTQWCARMTAGGSSAPASSVFTTATELVGSDIRVRCPPVSFLPSGHSHTAQPSTLSTQLLRLKQYSSTPALQHSSTHNNAHDHQLWPLQITNILSEQHDKDNKKKREGQQAARRLTKKNRTKKSFYIFLFRVSKGQKDRRTRKRTSFFFKRSQT
jgi:hypothetical protein